ncbi:MAG: type II secretion system protein [Eubacteriales bacterium]|nr:type II secretion system protein [Eubacteriales bacterium]
MKKRKKNSSKGFTLVELIVSFALTGLLLASASAVLANYGINTADMTAISQSELAASNLMDAIRAELMYAADYDGWYENADDDIKSYVSGKREGDAPKKIDVLIANGSKSIYFANRLGTLVKISCNDGRLSIRYGNPGGGSGNLGSRSTVDWDFGSGVYMANSINRLNFERITTEETPPKDTSVIKVTLVLENGKNGYRATRESCIECFNVPPTKIHVMESLAG